MPLDTSLLGQPVELGQIARELKKLWEASGGTKSRASLVNFAVLCSGTDALEENTRLISDFTRDHACRAILLASVAEPGAQTVESWINAHCHLPRAGAKQVCCEQITFVVRGQSQRLISNVLFANLDSDLPLYLWWQGELPAALDEQLWTGVDRLIFDSRGWADLAAQVERLQKGLSAASARLILCDLNWTRTLHLRQAVAQMFDQAENAALLADVKRLTLAFAPGNESTALLFAAWIAAQLGWSAGARAEGRLHFRTKGGTEIECEMRETPGAPVNLLEITTGGGTIAIQRQEGSPFYHAEARLDGRPASTHLLPASNDDLINLLDEELTLGGRHRVYLKALGTLVPMLATGV